MGSLQRAAGCRGRGRGEEIRATLSLETMGYDSPGTVISAGSMAQIALQRVDFASAPTLSNLLELYCHDLSATFDLRIGSDGRYGYLEVTPYLASSADHFAYLIQVEGQLAGFALARRGSPATSEPTDLDVAEFFVLRSHRARGIGRQAAFALWDAHPGHWVVRAALDNAPAVAFWRRTVAAYTGAQPVERTATHKGRTRHIFELDSRAEPA